MVSVVINMMKYLVVPSDIVAVVTERRIATLQPGPDMELINRIY